VTTKVITSLTAGLGIGRAVALEDFYRSPKGGLWRLHHPVRHGRSIKRSVTIVGGGIGGT
jgi:hypothetical protein